MAALSRLTARLPPRGFGGSCGLLDGDEPQGERRVLFASDKDRPVDQPALRRLAEFGDKIDRLSFLIEPAGVPPSRPHHEIGALVKQAGDALRLQIGAIGEADLALDDGDPIEGFASEFIGQLKEAETFARKVESAWPSVPPSGPLSRR